VTSSAAGEQIEILQRVALLASGGDPARLKTGIVDAWRRTVGARAAILLGREYSGHWTLHAATADTLAVDPAGVGAALEAHLPPDGQVVTIGLTEISVDLGHPGGDDARVDGVGVRLAPGVGPDFLLVGFVSGDGLPSPPEAVAALVAIAGVGFELMAIREEDAALNRIAGLVSAGMFLASELQIDDVLQRIADAARVVLGARYAAIGVLDRQRSGLEKFVTSGLSDATRTAIGDLPRGRGLLGALITDPRPIRIASIEDDPRAAGFPPHHPTMTTFLGVPIRVGTEVFGNLYVTDKLEGPFTDDDESLALAFAAQAAVAIANAQRYGEQQRAALVASQERERAAAQGLRRTIEAQEAERARIARELHDEAGQELTALTLQLRAMEDYVEGEVGRARLWEVRQALTRTASSLRELAIELRPSGLREHGLASAIQRHADRMRGASGIEIDVALGAIPDNLSEPVEIGLFRVIQEALTNVVRHSGATHASVVASHTGGRLRLVVDDDGIGFDPENATDRLGLAGIRERMELLGGVLRIESDRAVGTTVIVELEVPRE
jgi:signal transduction histidine kinase